MQKKSYHKHIDQLLRKHPALTLADELAAICTPLNMLGITYFSHAHISPDNEFTGLGNSPLFTELYFEQQHYQFDCHQDEIPVGEHYLLWDTIPITADTRKLEDDFNSCDYAHTFSIMNKSANGLDCYHFATSVGNDSMNGKYFQLLDPLKQFISYFKDKTLSDPALAHAYDLSVSMHKETGKFHKEVSGLAIPQFKELIQNDRHYALSGHQYLTTREVESLYWLSQGKTYEEAALILNISARTIKAHVEAVKQKTGAQNLFQLGVLFADLLADKQAR